VTVTNRGSAPTAAVTISVSDPRPELQFPTGAQCASGVDVIPAGETCTYELEVRTVPPSSPVTVTVTATDGTVSGSDDFLLLAAP
jgi:hypothetical protein